MEKPNFMKLSLTQVLFSYVCKVNVWKFAPEKKSNHKQWIKLKNKKICIESWNLDSITTGGIHCFRHAAFSDDVKVFRITLQMKINSENHFVQAVKQSGSKHICYTIHGLIYFHHHVMHEKKTTIINSYIFCCVKQPKQVGEKSTTCCSRHILLGHKKKEEKKIYVHQEQMKVSWLGTWKLKIKRTHKKHCARKYERWNHIKSKIILSMCVS